MALEPGIPLSGTLPQREHDKIDEFTGNKRVDVWGFDGANWNRGIVRSNGSFDVNIVSGGSSGGTQYTEGDVDTSITGTAVMWEDASDVLRAVSAAKPLPVDIKNATLAVTQSGTWTVTATPLTSTAGTPSGFTVSTSAILLKASNASRRAIAITNNGTSGIFIGHTSGVTASGAAMGLKLRPGGTYVDSGDGLYTGDIYAIGDAVAASQNVSVSERT